MWLPRFACPECGEGVGADGDGGFLCPACAAAFPRVQGIFRFMAPGRALSLEPFLRQYRAVRERDGFRESSPEYYRALPIVRRDDPRAAEWRIRRESYAALQAWALPAVWDGPTRVLDLGAGNCWLSHRLAASGHRVVAVDCLDDEVDGLGVHRHYPVSFVVVQGDFDALPFEPLQFEIVVLNGSLHYSLDPIATLGRAKAMLAPGGTIAVMDSPMFASDRAGMAMLDAQRRHWAEAWSDGAGPVQPGVGYLTFDALQRAAEALELRAQFFPSRGPLGWRVRRELGRNPSRPCAGGIRGVGRTMILFFNPLSTTPGKQPLPLSVLSLAAVVDGSRRWALVDGNVTADPAAAIIGQLAAVSPSEVTLLAVTVMPGPQLSQAVPVCKAVRRALPHVAIAWGGYFPTQHGDTVLRSDDVDFVVRSQGERPLLQLLEALERGETPAAVGGLSWKLPDRTIVHNPVGPSTPLDELPDLPYARVAMEDYIHPTCLGRRTVAHNSSFGCPFACSFCAVVAMSNRRWLAQSPARVEQVVARLKRDYQVDAVQMHDMDFFISEARVAEIADRIAPLGLSWWGLGRIDTLMQYSEDTFRKMARSGLRMVFSGAESASDATLKTMNKGGKAAAHLAIELAARMREHGIVPEYSFVLGSPPDPLTDMAQTFEFIRRIKAVNPATEVVLYTYTPVPLDGTMYAEAARLGFAFPETLDEWASDRWRQAMMRRGEHIPWMDGSVRTRVRNFERVLNAYYPTATDRRLTPARRTVLRAVSSWRYALRMYAAPYELRAIQKFIRYQRPETTGF